MGALDGLKVIDLSRLFPGPFCTAILADHGADVTVLEAPRFRDKSIIGDVPMLRRNKRHMSVDLKHPDGRSIFLRMVKDADVVVEGYRPGVAETLGVDYQTVSQVNPRIVYCSLTGYGQDGPLATKAGHDLNLMALAGMLDLTRDERGWPVMPNFPVAGLAGSVYGVIGILMALHARERTGRGQRVDSSMTDGLLSQLALPLAHLASGSVLPGRVDSSAREVYPCYRVYETRDQRYLSVGPLERHLWEKLCVKLGCPAYGPLQFDPDYRAEIADHLEKLFKTRDLAHWLDLLDEPDDCVAPVVNVSELANVEHFVSRGMIDTTGGAPQPGVAPKLSDTPGKIRRPPYRFGTHTREILEELGYTGDEIGAMEEGGVVWGED